MKLRSVFGSTAFSRRSRGADAALREAVTDAAAGALRGELAGHDGAKITVSSIGARRIVGSSDPADAAREFGTLKQPASPWLAPVLPLAFEPMRAAARARIREIFAIDAGKENAAARAVSVLRKRKN